MNGSLFGFGGFPGFHGFDTGVFITSNYPTIIRPSRICSLTSFFFVFLTQVLARFQTWVEVDLPPSRLLRLVVVGEAGTSDQCRRPPKSSTAKKLPQKSNE